MTYKFNTLAIHAGQDPDPVTGAVIPSISLSTTFKQPMAGQPLCYDYSRSGNPTRSAFETAVAALEGAKYGLAFASGSVTTATVTSMLASGSHIICISDCYGGTFRYLTKVLATHGVVVDFVDLVDPKNLKSAIRSNTKMVWIETPTNPTLKLVDIQAIADITHGYPGVTLVVDNTFMSPYNQQPLSLGADIVVHSATKYINGHSDVVMGVLVTNSDELYTKLAFLQNSIGGVPSAFDCFLANRGLKTLHLRMQRHSENALDIAKYLEASPYVENVIYPGLVSHPQHELAKRQQTGYGGMISFRIKNADLSVSNSFLSNLKIFVLAESLGGIESLAELPMVMTHGSLGAELCTQLGITENLIRLSIGVEDVKDLIEDLEQALVIASRIRSKL
ncbi:Cys/Met metabolism PLP-dependent enzyme-domain-containing protein [Globomyces pollinis-pini]|nr:Cys/Met metabolism PLP-dependent enzyme-domain-containing protein [Globomyces pollinis-pini]